MKYLVIALKPEANEVIVHQEFSSMEDNEGSSLYGDSYDHFEDDEVRTEYEQDHFHLRALLKQSRAEIDAEMEEEVDGIADDGVTVIMRATHKRYHVAEKDSLQDVLRYLQALHVCADEEYTPAEAKFEQGYVSHCIVEVGSDFHDSRPLSDVAISYFMLKPEDYAFSDTHQALMDMEARIADITTQINTQDSRSSELRDLVVEREKLKLGLQELQEQLLEMVEGDFVKFANPRRLEEKKLEEQNPAERRAEGGMLLRRSSSGLFRLAGRNDNNAPYDDKGKEEEGNYARPGL